MKAILNTKVDPELKREAQKVAKEMGLPLSVLVNQSLKKIVEQRSVTFQAPLIPNERTAKHLKQVLAEIKRGEYKKWPRFKNGKELIAYLHKKQ